MTYILSLSLSLSLYFFLLLLYYYNDLYSLLSLSLSPSIFVSSYFSQIGFDSVFFARNDYADKALRLNTSQMEMIWEGSQSLGNVADIFTGVLYHHYVPPPGFCFDSFCSDPPIMVT